MAEMVAGRDLDRQIAERVFGRTTLAHSSRPITHGKSFDGYWSWSWMDGEVRIVQEMPRFSTDIGAAWQVFVWLTETTGRCIIIADMEEWDADNAVIVRCGLDEERDLASYWQPAPLALCVAALDYLDRKDGKA